MSLCTHGEGSLNFAKMKMKISRCIYFFKRSVLFQAFGEHLFAPSKSKTEQNAQIPDAEMETALLPQAGFLLDSKATALECGRFLAALRLFARHSISYAIWRKRYGYTLERLIRINLQESSRDTRQKPPGGGVGIGAACRCPHGPSRGRLKFPGVWGQQTPAL